MSINRRIKERRIALGLSQHELAMRLGYKDKSSIAKIERENNDFPQHKISKFAAALETTEAYLMGWDECLPNNIIPMPKMRRIPLIGTIACGTPITAEENYDGDVDLPDTIRADFALRCKGDSMINARIFDGDICYIRRQPTVENGQIAAVLIDDEATLKRVRLFDDHIVLEPENPQFRPLVYWGEEMAAVSILGLAVAFTSSVR